LRGTGIVDGSIDIDVRAQIFRKLFLLAPSTDCISMETHVPRKLNTKMPEATDALHGDQVSSAQARLTAVSNGKSASVYL
jgi:hypothetical protein